MRGILNGIPPIRSETVLPMRSKRRKGLVLLYVIASTTALVNLLTANIGMYAYRRVVMAPTLSLSMTRKDREKINLSRDCYSLCQSLTQ